jgi:hypothetical protein
VSRSENMASCYLFNIGPEKTSSTLLKKVCKFLPDYTVSKCYVVTIMDAK